MCTHITKPTVSSCLIALVLILCSLPATAVDGVIEINHHRALAGEVTASDTPGYPVTIDTQGSYRLTGNLRLADNQTDGIVIATFGNVSIDLNGFEIQGPAKTGGLGTGIRLDAPGNELAPGGISVRNGRIAGMHNGLELGAYSQVSDVIIDVCGGVGIRVLGASIVRDNSVFGCNVWGIDATGSLVRNNAVTFSGSSGEGGERDEPTGGGIRATSSSSVLGNVANSNFNVGIFMGSQTGYEDNVVGATLGTHITGGVKLGTNVCGGAPC